MMKKKNLYPLFFVPILSFLACTADVGYAPNEKHLNVSPSYKVEKMTDLPACEGDFENVAVRVMEYWNLHKDYVGNGGFLVFLGTTEDTRSSDKLADLEEASPEMKKKRQDFLSVRKLDGRELGF